MKPLAAATGLAIAAWAALGTAQPLDGAAARIDPATGRIAAPRRAVTVDTTIEPGDAQRKSYAVAHKARHAKCNRASAKRGDDVGCGGDDIKDKVKDKDKDKAGGAADDLDD